MLALFSHGAVAQNSGDKMSAELRAIAEAHAKSAAPAQRRAAPGAASAMTAAIPGLGTVTFGEPSQVEPLAMIHDDMVMIEAVANGSTQSLMRQLRTLGLENAAMRGRVVSGFLPIDSVMELNNVSGLAFAKASAAETNVGAVLNEAVQAQRVDKIDDFDDEDDRLTGRGLSIGILSDSFDCQQPSVPNAGSYAADIASGDLPDDVVVLEDFFGGCIDEGRAMAQLIHDIAPGAKLLFHTAFGGQANFAGGIIDLADAGADVIVDDVRYFAEPIYSDGIIAQAVDEVAARGIPYFSSAGNAANLGYEAPFLSSGVVFSFPPLYGSQEWIFHDFGGGDFLNEVTIVPGGSATFVLQWDDPFASVSTTGVGADTDLDFHLFSPDLSTYFGCIFCNENVGGDPFEGFSVGGPFEFVIAVGLRVESNPDTLVNIYASSSAAQIEYTGGPTSWGHNNARGAIGTGAAFWGTTPAFGVSPPQLNGFSSYGGLPILFDLAGNRLPEPDFRPGVKITAVDGSNNTFFFNDSARDEDAFPNFFGTSAAAPNAAAVALLMLEENRDLSPDNVLEILQASAIDIVGTNDVGGPANNQNVPLFPGFDLASGAGLIRADVAIELADDFEDDDDDDDDDEDSDDDDDSDSDD